MFAKGTELCASFQFNERLCISILAWTFQINIYNKIQSKLIFFNEMARCMRCIHVTEHGKSYGNFRGLECLEISKTARHDENNMKRLFEKPERLTSST